MIDRDAGRVASLQGWASDRGRSVAELAIVWLASQLGVGPVIAGASTANQVRANAAAAKWVLTPEEIEAVSGLA